MRPLRRMLVWLAVLVALFGVGAGFGAALGGGGEKDPKPAESRSVGGASD